mmetsp:Transcript_40361/g.114192  ORF Transcript_40361/g.114192 Transcript_40361/m.114192 type:complete len:225 (-) Transcript_40361:23-697(-)
MVGFGEVQSSHADGLAPGRDQGDRAVRVSGPVELLAGAAMVAARLETPVRVGGEVLAVVALQRDRVVAVLRQLPRLPVDDGAVAQRDCSVGRRGEEREPLAHQRDGAVRVLQDPERLVRPRGHRGEHRGLQVGRGAEDAGARDGEESDHPHGEDPRLPEGAHAVVGPHARGPRPRVRRAGVRGGFSISFLSFGHQGQPPAVDRKHRAVSAETALASRFDRADAA